ncbi:MAG: hypothetical protein WC707_02320 [Candidatus Babeliaceae bacterium]|jgi:hypothetical protein
MLKKILLIIVLSGVIAPAHATHGTRTSWLATAGNFWNKLPPSTKDSYILGMRIGSGSGIIIGALCIGGYYAITCTERFDIIADASAACVMTSPLLIIPSVITPLFFYKQDKTFYENRYKQIHQEAQCIDAKIRELQTTMHHQPQPHIKIITDRSTTPDIDKLYTELISLWTTAASLRMDIKYSQTASEYALLEKTKTLCIAAENNINAVKNLYHDDYYNKSILNASFTWRLKTRSIEKDIRDNNEKTRKYSEKINQMRANYAGIIRAQGIKACDNLACDNLIRTSQANARHLRTEALAGRTDSLKSNADYLQEQKKLLHKKANFSFGCELVATATMAYCGYAIFLGGHGKHSYMPIVACRIYKSLHIPYKDALLNNKIK